MSLNLTFDTKEEYELAKLVGGVMPGDMVIVNKVGFIEPRDNGLNAAWLGHRFGVLVDPGDIFKVE